MVARALGRESGRVLEPPKPMREQQNPSTPELHQPLLFAPSELLACGLRDAHHHPLVGVRTEDGVRSWRTSPARAWAFPLIEWVRTGNSYAALGFDCDSREAVELLDRLPASTRPGPSSCLLTRIKASQNLSKARGSQPSRTCGCLSRKRRPQTFQT